ncbi:MAG: TIGR03435 family protein [Vicinamibacterales bacterium]
MKVAVVIGVMVVGLAGVSVLAIAAQDARGAALPAFDVASVRRNVVGGVPRMRVEGGRFVASNSSLRELILTAYRTQSFQVVGGPEWWQPAPGPSRAAPASPRSGNVTFDVIASIPQNAPPAQVPLMLRRLLAQRFNLVVHTEMRDMPVYLLTHARDDKRLGPRLTRSTHECQTEIDGGPLRAPVTRVTDDGKPLCGMMLSPASIRGGGLTMRFLAHALTGYARRIVLDRTELEGPFDFHLTYAPSAPGGAPAPSDDRPSVFTAVREQLGLKLEAATASVEVLVVDSVSMPTEN